MLIKQTRLLLLFFVTFLQISDNSWGRHSSHYSLNSPKWPCLLQSMRNAHQALLVLWINIMVINTSLGSNQLWLRWHYSYCFHARERRCLPDKNFSKCCDIFGTAQMISSNWFPLISANLIIGFFFCLATSEINWKCQVERKCSFKCSHDVSSRCNVQMMVLHHQFLYAYFLILFAP